jgi:acetyl esterase/lipase
VACLGTRLFNDGARNGGDIIDDTLAGIRAIADEAGLLGGSPSSVILLGSGSGSLAALALAAKPASTKANDNAPRVRAAIACGVTPSCEAWEGCPLTLTKTLHQFADGNAARDLNPMRQKVEAFPPLLLLHGDHDRDVPPKAAHHLQARLDGGALSDLVLLAGAEHQFIEDPACDAARTALDRIATFLADHASEPVTAGGFAGLFDR